MVTYRNTILQGDALAVLKTLPDELVQVVVTSPPYWGLRDYQTATWEGGDTTCSHQVGRFETNCSSKQKSNSGSAGHQARHVCPKCGAVRTDHQLGLEPTPGAYIAKMVEIFAEVRRVLRSDGLLALNMGDSYNAGREGGHAGGQKGISKPENAPNRSGGNAPGLKPKDLCCIPWALAMALRDDGWWLRAAFPWVKRSAMPGSQKDRPTSALEYVFLLAKRSRYYFDFEAVKKEAIHGENRATFRGGGVYADRIIWGKDNSKQVSGDGEVRERPKTSSRAWRNADLWFESIEGPHGLTFLGDEPVGLDVNPKGYKEAHFATFPEKLVEPCIKAGTSEKGCCAECGMPWERVVKLGAIQSTGGGSGREASGTCNLGRGDSNTGKFVQREHVSLGWRPQCECKADVVPCLVCDPFGGSGTVGKVAAGLGRDYLLIELSAEYIKMAKARIHGPLFAGEKT